MSDKFDISQFNKYREDNRFEVKAAEGGLRSKLSTKRKNTNIAYMVFVV